MCMWSSSPCSNYLRSVNHFAQIRIAAGLVHPFCSAQCNDSARRRCKGGERWWLFPENQSYSGSAASPSYSVLVYNSAISVQWEKKRGSSLWPSIYPSTAVMHETSLKITTVVGAEQEGAQDDGSVPFGHPRRSKQRACVQCVVFRLPG